MNRIHPLFIFITLLILQPGAVRADDAANASFQTRMRETLRATMQQLSDAQNQVATLQAAQAQSDKDNADLKAKVEALNGQLKSVTDQAAADKAASEKTIADLKQGNQDLTTEMVDTLSIQINLLNKAGTDDKATLEKSIADMKSKDPASEKALSQYGTDIGLWKTGYYQYVQYAAQTEAARSKLATEAIMLQRVVDDRERKNLELFSTANEILTRYEKFSLGDALSAKEPFVGLTRVKLEELVQDYQDKLQADKIRIGEGAAMVAQGPSSGGSASDPGARAVAGAKP